MTVDSKTEQVTREDRGFLYEIKDAKVHDASLRNRVDESIIEALKEMKMKGIRINCKLTGEPAREDT